MTDVRPSTKLALLVGRSVMCRGQATGPEAGSWPPSFHPDLHEKVQERLSAECGEFGRCLRERVQARAQGHDCLIWDDSAASKVRDGLRLVVSTTNTTSAPVG